MDWDEEEGFKNLPAKKARPNSELTQMTLPPMSPSDDMEDLYGTPPAILEAIATNTDVESKGSNAVNGVSVMTRHINLPGLEPSPNNLFTEDSLASTSKLRGKAEDRTHSKSIGAIEDLMTLGVQSRDPGTEITTPAVDLIIHQSSAMSDALETNTVSPEHHPSCRSPIQTNQSLKAEHDFNPPMPQTTQKVRQVEPGHSEIKIDGESSLHRLDQYSVVSETVSDIHEGQAGEVVKLENYVTLCPSETDDWQPTPSNSTETTTPAIGGLPIAKDDITDLTEETTSLGEGEGEFKIDTSPIQSSSSESSSDLSSDDSDSDGDDYEMLDPEEQARRLMQEDGCSDDDAGKSGANGVTKGQLRSVNEKPDEVVEKPDVVVTPDLRIQELGAVETIVENTVLIKAKVSGEYQVLETGSVLCLEDREVLGAVAETLGRVQQPRYSVRFTNAQAIRDAGITVGVRVFYVVLYSTYVFTQSLKAFKGSDASNIYDEEVDEDELEFSDDEAELEHKHNKKRQKQKKRGALWGLNDGSSRGARPNDSSIRIKDGETMDYNDTANINYDDVAQDEEPYTPLTRPTNLHEMMNETKNLPNNRRNHGDCSGSHNRGRGRGERDRNYGDQSDGGRGRGRDRGSPWRKNFQDRKNSSYRPHPLPATPAVTLPPCPPLLPHSIISPNQPQISSSLYNQQIPSYFPQSHQNLQNYGYNMHQQPQFPSNLNHNQYTHSSTTQSYNQPQSQILYNQFPMPQPQSPYYCPQPSPTIPPGAYVNPAFFSNQSQVFQGQARQGYSPQQQTFQQQGRTSPCGQSRSRTSPESDATFVSVQEKLSLLRELSKGSGSPT